LKLDRIELCIQVGSLASQLLRRWISFRENAPDLD